VDPKTGVDAKGNQRSTTLGAGGRGSSGGSGSTRFPWRQR
jgi:hypothetical protein